MLVQTSGVDDPRDELLRDWVADHYPGFQISVASADASFRRYFRLERGAESFILMDAPPEHQDCRPFIHAASRLLELGLNVPRVLQTDLEHGLLVLTDFGDCSYLRALSQDTADTLYDAALRSLLILQSEGRDPGAFPPYDRPFLMRELRIFDQWFLDRHLALSLPSHQRDLLEQVYQWLCDKALEQPRVWVHRDFHSRNLMVCGAQTPGVLDFQDAVIGPISYDPVSLLRDCYIAWPVERVEAWSQGHRRRLVAAGALDPGIDQPTWNEWFDCMGVQRHLKAIGIFARLWHRDGKPGYLKDIPRTLGYVWSASARHPALTPLTSILEQHVADRVGTLPR